MPKSQRNTRGAGSIQKLDNGKYKIAVVVGYDANGKMKRKTFTANTRKEAQLKLNEYNHAKDNKSLLISSRCTLLAYCEHYKLIKKQEVKQGTYDDYVAIIDNHIKTNLGHYPIQNINATILDNYFVEKSNTLASSSVLKHKAVISDIFKHAKREKLILSNPINDCIISPKPSSRRDMVYDDEQLQSLLSKADEWKCICKRHGTDKFIGCIIRTALATSARIGEVLAIDFEDIDTSGNTISINKTISEVKGGIIATTPKTENSKRIIGISPKLITMLDELRDNIETKHIFHTRTGNYFAPSNVERSWRKLLKESGLPKGYHIHDFRHTQITNAISKGMNIADVSRRAGHADIRTTINMYYTSDIEKDKVIASLSDKWL